MRYSCLQLKLTSVGHPAISLENISWFSQKYIKFNLTSIAINQTHCCSSSSRHALLVLFVFELKRKKWTTLFEIHCENLFYFLTPFLNGLRRSIRYKGALMFKGGLPIWEGHKNPKIYIATPQFSGCCRIGSWCINHLF